MSVCVLGLSLVSKPGPLSEGTSFIRLNCKFNTGLRNQLDLLVNIVLYLVCTSKRESLIT